jgi:hypothetical protein
MLEPYYEIEVISFSGNDWKGTILEFMREREGTGVLAVDIVPFLTKRPKRPV